ncbi:MULTISPECIES: type II toxin-antitoxin system RelE/ParE family toxin [Shewanella]|uniref:type II toxin-antitoxin system RelE/ParE family toxin n=1 Tax=Shewanella TaxID=22 RepID=UPI00313DC2A8
MNTALEIFYTDDYKADAKVAINWKSKLIGKSEARDEIKSLLQDIDNQLRLFPESGRTIEFVPIGVHYLELLKGDYRAVYKIDKQPSGKLTLYLLMFCHQRMDYQTLMRQRHMMKIIGR